jgi:hypothetical protein
MRDHLGGIFIPEIPELSLVIDVIHIVSRKVCKKSVLIIFSKPQSLQFQSSNIDRTFYLEVLEVKTETLKLANT